MEEHSRCPAPLPPGSFSGARRIRLFEIRKARRLASPRSPYAKCERRKAAYGDPPLFFVKLQGSNLYTSDFVFVPQFTRCSVVLCDRERGRQMRYSTSRVLGDALDRDFEMKANMQKVAQKRS
jgi:hypothetical protein